MALSNSAKSLLLAGAAALVMALPVDQARAVPPRTLGACTPTKVKFALSRRTTTTALTSFVNLPDTGFGFVQARRGCVIVDFTAFEQINDPPPDIIYIRAQLKKRNGTIVSGRPSSARLNFTVGGSDSRTTQFVFPNVTPGRYVINMQAASSSGGGLTVSSPNIVVHYN
jgi:hypothetical protein